jgi:mono/diheme cytochrome c family protein
MAVLKPAIAALAAGALGATALAAPEPPGNGAAPVQRLVDRGALTYRKHCASCHGASAKGDGPMAAHLKQAPSDLTLLAKRHGGVFPSLRVSDSIDGRSSVNLGAHGTREMPVWGTVFRGPAQPGAPRARDPDHEARQHMVDLLEYLARIQEK